MARKLSRPAWLKKIARRHRSKLQVLSAIGIISAFAATGAALLTLSKAAPGVCSPSTSIGSTTHTVNLPEAGTYRLWVRMQVPDTNNTGNLNGVHVELNGNQCFAVTTTNSNTVNQWQWVRSSATAPQTAHITSHLNAGNNTVRVIGTKNNVRVDKVLLLSQANNCEPSNNFTNGEPGENCTTPAPEVTFTRADSPITSGTSTTLNWSSTNAHSCNASGATNWNGSRNTSGSQSTGNLTSNQTYNLSCSGPGGSTSRSVTVEVQAPSPTLTFTASPLSITSGSSSTLQWSTTNANSCIASGGWSGSRQANGSQSTGSLTSSRTFTLECTGTGGSITRSVTVSVQASSDPPVVYMLLSGIDVPNGASSITVNNQRNIIWQPQVSSVSGVQSVEYYVNDSRINLISGRHTISENGDYRLRITATGNNGQSTTSSLTVRLRHPDFNRDGEVGLHDFSSLLRQWGKQSTIYDLNADGTVGLYDFSYVLRQWGK